MDGSERPETKTSLVQNTHIHVVINVIIPNTEQDMKCMYNVTLWCAHIFAFWPLLR